MTCYTSEKRHNGYCAVTFHLPFFSAETCTSVLFSCRQHANSGLYWYMTLDKSARGIFSLASFQKLNVFRFWLRINADFFLQALTLSQIFNNFGCLKWWDLSVTFIYPTQCHRVSLVICRFIWNCGMIYLFLHTFGGQAWGSVSVYLTCVGME